MALLIKALILSLFYFEINGQNCQIPTNWTQYPTINENVKIGDKLLKVEDENTAKIKSVKLTESSAAAKYVDFEKFGNNGWALNVKAEITNAVDCVSN